MIPTFFGIAIGMIGLLLLVIGSTPLMFGFVILCSMFGASAAFILPAIGGSSIPPVQFALGFLVLRFLLPGSGQGANVRQALLQNLFLICFVAYGVAIAYAGPRIFADGMYIAPMKMPDGYLFATFALMPSSQNITASVYLLGTMMCALGAYVACRNEGGDGALVKAGIIVASLHILFGIIGVLFADTGYASFLQVIRNGSYAQVDQRIGTVVRMNGLLSEPSSFAAYGFGWFVFLFECWYRDVIPRVTGPVALAMALTLAASTSSTAYLGLAAYAGLFAVRTMLAPDGVSSRKLLRIALAFLVMAIFASIVLILSPGLVERAGSIITQMTIAKQGSTSALQRAFWARQGPAAFGVSYGLGIGPGSFRSSSLPMAVLGATGLVGVASLSAYVMSVLKPLRASTYNRVLSVRDATGVAAAWAAVGILIPASLISPTSDPGSDFAIFAGASLALRQRRFASKPASSAPPAEGAFLPATSLHAAP